MTRIIQAGLPRSKRGSHLNPPKPRFVPMTAAPRPIVRREGADAVKNIPSGGLGVGNATVSLRKVYDDPELQAREEAAREVIHTVAPICNKGGYQLITGNDIKTAGRKV